MTDTLFQAPKPPPPYRTLGGDSAAQVRQYQGYAARAKPPEAAKPAAYDVEPLRERERGGNAVVWGFLTIVAAAGYAVCEWLF